VAYQISTPPPPDLTRAYSAARTFINEQRQPQDLIAVMTFQGGAVKVKHDFTSDRAQLEDVFLRLIYGDDLDGDDAAVAARTEVARVLFERPAPQRNDPAMPPLIAFVSFYRGDVKAFETAPGRYECQVTVLNPSSQKVAFWRTEIFLVP
jgi:hypothetical protein